MPISVSCSQCRKALAAPDKYAGRSVKCPGCAAPIAIPAARSDDDDPLGFAGGGDGPLVASVGGKAVDPGGRDDGVTPAVLELRREPGWAGVIGGLNNIWIGSSLQVLGVTTVVLILGLLVSLGSGTAALASGDERHLFQGGKVTALLVPGCMLVFVVGGILLRLVGFCRCLATPAGSGAWVLALLALGCELAALTGSSIGIIGPFLIPALGALGNLAAGLASFVGLVILLVYLRQVGAALAARAIPARVLHFVLWLVLGGVVGFPALLGTGFGMIYIANAAGRGSALAYLAIPGILLIVLTVVALPLTLLIKYLGTLSLVADEIGKRTGQGRSRGRRSTG